MLQWFGVMGLIPGHEPFLCGVEMQIIKSFMNCSLIDLFDRLTINWLLLRTQIIIYIIFYIYSIFFILF